MLGKRRILALLVFSVLTFLGMFSINTTKVKAYYYDNDAMKVAPSGIDLKDLGNNDALFVRGKYTGFMPIANPDRNDSSIYPILQMSDNSTKNVTSSLWSNNSNDNYLDVTQKQTLSFWIYFGDSYSDPQGTAFVLQNAGDQAIAVGKDGGIAGGESMGVWGSDIPDKANNAAIAASAIPKSWALEFDTRSNNNGYTANDIDKSELGNAFDTYQRVNGGGGSVSGGLPHLAWGYPARASTYNIVRSYTTGGGLFDPAVTHNVFQMLHNNNEELYFAGLNKVTDSWHHVQIEYNPPAEKGGIAHLLKRVELHI